MLGPAQTDALRAETAGAGSVLGGVGVGPNAQMAHPVGDLHEAMHRSHDRIGVLGVGIDLALEVLHDGGGLDRDLAEEDLTRCAVDRDGVALVDDDATRRGELLSLYVDLELFGAAHAGAAHAASNHCGV